MFQEDHKRAILAVVLSGFVLFGWQYYFAPSTNGKLTEKVPSTTQASTAAPAQSILPTSGQGQSASSIAPSAPVEIVSATATLKNANASYVFNNDLSLTAATNGNELIKFSDFAGSSTPFNFEIYVNNKYEKVKLNLDHQSETEVQFSNQVIGLKVKASLLENGKINFLVNSSAPLKYRIHFQSSEKKLENGQIRHFSFFAKDTKVIEVGKNDDGEGLFKWVGIDFDYHILALVFAEKVVAKYTTTKDGSFFIEATNNVNELKFDLVFTKKNYDHLISLGDQLHLSVDFGIFSILAVPMLRGIQMLYDYIPNYGFAIIVITLLIRLVTFPLQFKSFKSMKKMQEIQPELQKLKEKHKDDSMAMQKETMELFKRAGANPLSGCLPLLLQMPFFFAIYKVISNSVELVGAPFFGWIKDLSVHDPFYVLPVLMAASMFLQQKITPQSTMDPMQQKIMLAMPLIFGFIMKDLPAGLVLYIFVSTAFGIVQQYFVYKVLD